MAAMWRWVGMAGVVMGFAVGATGQAIAGPVVGELWLNQTAAAQNATIANAPITTPDAMFTTVNLDYRSELQTNGYTVGGFLMNPSFFNTSAAFSPSASLNNTYFLFTGQTFLNAGNNSFVVGHDDGVELNFPALNGGASVVFAPGGTIFSNSPFTVNAPTAGLYNFTLSYGEAFSAPGDLVFQINGAPVGSIPEPSSMIIGSTGLLMLLGYAWRRRRKVTSVYGYRPRTELSSPTR